MRNRKKITHNELDITLLSCGLVDLDVFRKCIESIVSEGKDFNASIYVFLNGAPKETRGDYENILREHPEIKVRQGNDRLGYPAGANRIIKQGSSPLFLFITDDIILHPGSLRYLVDRMKGDEAIGVCGMKLVFPKESTDPGRPAGRVQHIGHGIDIRGRVTHPLIGWSPENPKCNVSREVSSVTGAIFIARRSVFLKAGGFWEGYGLGYFEDVDMCLSVRQLGYKVWIEPAAVATHYTNMTMMKLEERPNMSGNEMIFISRNRERLVNDSWTFW